MGDVMSPAHPRWREFAERLEGPDGCDFREGDQGPTWTCLGGRNRPRAVEIMRTMGLNDDAVLASLDYFDNHGGYCDCEILLNVDREKPCAAD